jgi:hypothetical protein
MSTSTESPDWIAPLGVWTPASYALGGIVLEWQDREDLLDCLLALAYPDRRSEDN